MDEVRATSGRQIRLTSMATAPLSVRLSAEALRGPAAAGDLFNRSRTRPVVDRLDDAAVRG
jgi:hypothetical protein